MTRKVRLAVSVAIAASVAAVGLAGCGRAGGGPTSAGAEEVEFTNMSWDAQALESIGYSADLLGIVDSGSTPTAGPGDDRPGHDKARDRRHRFHKVRYGFGRHVLHGEAVVQTDEGVKTVVVQRGEVTAVTASTVTVKSTDGFTLTWTFGDPLTVVKERKRVDKGVLAVGERVGLAGAKVGDTTNARLIVIPGAQQEK